MANGVVRCPATNYQIGPNRFISDDHMDRFQGKIVGIFNYPARRELADHPNCFLNGKQPWIRDRAGFMKCGVCGKRNKRVRRFLLEALFDFLGANLYPGAPGAFRTPEGYGDSTR